MFELRLIDDKDKFEAIDIICIHCKKITGFFLRNSTFEKMITIFMLNSIFHHVGMSWIISSNGKYIYEMDNSNHQDWLNTLKIYLLLFYN